MSRSGASLADGFFQYSLLLLVATGFAAVLSTGRLDEPTAALAAAALLGRAFIIKGWMKPPLSAFWVQALTIAYILFYPVDFLYLSGSFLGATVRMIFFLASIKLLTANHGRDYLYLSIIALLEVLAAAMLTSSASILGFLALFLVFAVAARTRYEIQRNAEVAVHKPAAGGSLGWRLSVLSLALAGGIALLALALFFVVPRAAGAYLSRLPAAGESVLGFSDEIVLGTPGRVRRDKTPVMRVKILEGPPLNNLKWRGDALQYFDGVKWSNPPSIGHVLAGAQGRYIVGRLRRRSRLLPGAILRYRVLRAPMDCDSLFLPGTPQILEGDFGRLEVSDTDSISTPGGRWKPLRYEGWSFIGPARPAEAGDVEGPFQTRIRSRYLQLPALDPRIPALARQITEAEMSPYSRAVAIERYLRTHFGYTLELPLERLSDPLADFLFNRKKGHCEYFASAMAVMLRSIGIPARVADGFQSGVYNPVSGYYTIRASEAHAWVEAYFAGLGWATFDPTPPEPAPEALLGRSWQYLDALETFWNDWIIQYDVNRQASLARSVQIEWYKAGYETMERWDRVWLWAGGRWERWKQKPAQAVAGTLQVVAGFLAACVAVWALPRVRAWVVTQRVSLGRGSHKDCALLYERALAQMQRRGFNRETWQTAGEFAKTVQPPECPAAVCALLGQITQSYERARFGCDGEAGRRLALLIRTLERSPV
jgi:transglutaminase-like putative cysteine protease